MWTRCLGWFSVMWVTKLMISPVKKGFFAQKRPNLAQNWHFCPLLAHLVPCWRVGWWFWRGLYLARHLFTLFNYQFKPKLCYFSGSYSTQSITNYLPSVVVNWNYPQKELYIRAKWPHLLLVWSLIPKLQVKHDGS